MEAKPLVHSASYTTSTAGRSLKWLPHRSQGPTTDSQVVAVAHEQKAASDPFTDPFGDASKKALTVSSPVKPLGEVPTRELTIDQLPAEVLPDFPPVNAPSAVEAQTSQSPRTARAVQGAKKSESPARTLEQELAAVHQELKAECPKPEDLKPISRITHVIKPEEGRLPPECTLGAKVFEPRSWSPMTYAWRASCLCHKPAYFEEYQLERYGHSWGPYLQPVVSLGHFFVSVPLLPYLMGLNPPSECMYSLGYYRPGSCAPYMLDPLPLSVRAGLFEAGAVVGAAAILP